MKNYTFFATLITFKNTMDLHKHYAQLFLKHPSNPSQNLFFIILCNKLKNKFKYLGYLKIRNAQRAFIEYLQKIVFKKMK